MHTVDSKAEAVDDVLASSGIFSEIQKFRFYSNLQNQDLKEKNIKIAIPLGTVVYTLMYSTHEVEADGSL